MWEKILIYAAILIFLYIFVKLSQLKINNKPVLPLYLRILISLFFPIIFVIILLLSSIIFSFLLLIILFIVFLYFVSKFKRKSFIKFKKIKIK